MTTLKQKHEELLDQLDISSTLKTILYEGIRRNEKDWLIQKREELELSINKDSWTYPRIHEIDKLLEEITILQLKVGEK